MARFLGIDLTEGVQKRHLLAYFLAAFISSSYAGALAMLQPGLLQVMAIDPGRQATLTGNLSAMQEVILIVHVNTEVQKMCLRQNLYRSFSGLSAMKVPLYSRTPGAMSRESRSVSQCRYRARTPRR